MQLKLTPLGIAVAAITTSILAFQAPAALGQVLQAPKNFKTTKIKVEGLFAESLLTDSVTNTNGFLTVSTDPSSNTSTLDFSYGFADPSNPDVAILVQGVGEIPNNAFGISSTTAHLAVTTPFAVNRCAINTATGDVACVVVTPSRFDLTWTVNGYEVTMEKTRTTTILGPVTTKSQGDFTSRSAIVRGTFDGRAMDGPFGRLLETQSSTATREVTAPAMP